MNVTDFIEFLLDENLIHQVTLKKERHEIERFYQSQFTKFELGLSLLSKSYLSHHSALEIYGLTKIKSKQIFVTQELSPKNNNDSILEQSAVDAAFEKKQRPLSQIYKYRSTEFCLLNAKFSNRLGVIKMTIDEQNVTVTDLERTLIDAVVRPAYSGGVTTIMKAFSNARTNLDARKLYNYFLQLNFKYPYHQAIGFYLEHANYPQKDWQPFLDLPQTINFYLDYNMENKFFFENWKIYVPSNLVKPQKA